MFSEQRSAIAIVTVHHFMMCVVHHCAQHYTMLHADAHITVLPTHRAIQWLHLNTLYLLDGIAPSVTCSRVGTERSHKLNKTSALQIVM